MKRRKLTKQEEIVRCIDRCSRAMTTCYRHWSVHPSDMRMILAVLAAMHNFSNHKIGIVVESD